jgi:hypothetical protein
VLWSLVDDPFQVTSTYVAHKNKLNGFSQTPFSLIYNIQDHLQQSIFWGIFLPF